MSHCLSTGILPLRKLCRWRAWRLQRQKVAIKSKKAKSKRWISKHVWDQLSQSYHPLMLFELCFFVVLLSLWISLGLFWIKLALRKELTAKKTLCWRRAFPVVGPLPQSHRPGPRVRLKGQTIHIGSCALSASQMLMLELPPNVVHRRARANAGWVHSAHLRAPVWTIYLWDAKLQMGIWVLCIQQQSQDYLRFGMEGWEWMHHVPEQRQRVKTPRLDILAQGWQSFNFPPSACQLPLEMVEWVNSAHLRAPEWTIWDAEIQNGYLMLCSQRQS